MTKLLISVLLETVAFHFGDRKMTAITQGAYPKAALSNTHFQKYTLKTEN